ncbi:hypothetical protein DFS34DRAFT_652657 [Phlyctochytrium arcticum]|nr:hypothetical protein DFS34DRAFT_652657 [Phlyctochytrium arcticum]
MTNPEFGPRLSNYLNALIGSLAWDLGETGKGAMRTDIRDLPLSQDLLDYYRQRLDQWEKDYQDVLDKIDCVRLQHEDAHRVAWEAHKRTAEIADLQKALSDAEELKDRKKIRYLLKITPTPENETTYFRNKLDKRLVEVENEPLQKMTRNGRDEDSIPMDRDDEIESLRVNLASLRTQLEEQTQMYEATIAGLKRDRQTRMDEEKSRRQYESQKIEDLMEKLQKLRALCRENIKELLHTKKSANAYEKRLVEEKTNLVEELHSSKSQLTTEQHKAENAEKNIENRVTKKQETLVTDLRSQLGRYEREIHSLKAKSDDTEKGYKRRIDYLQSRLSAVTSTYTALKRRRDYEIEGFTNDILMLRKQLKMLERNILRYAPLEDKELVLLNLAKETGQRVSKISSELHGLKAKIYSTEEDVRSIKF